jgi:hypothetical protein
VGYPSRPLLKQLSDKLPATAWVTAQAEFAGRHGGDREASTLEWSRHHPQPLAREDSHDYQDYPGN